MFYSDSLPIVGKVFQDGDAHFYFKYEFEL